MAYQGEPKLSPLARVLPGTHKLTFLIQSNRPQERSEFYWRQQRALWDRLSTNAGNVMNVAAENLKHARGRGGRLGTNSRMSPFPEPK
jgi:hypothetical protein